MKKLESSKFKIKTCQQSLVTYLPDLLALVFFVGSLFFSLKVNNFFNNDSAWILRTGDFIRENHEIPRVDFLSWSQENKELIAYQWLFSLLVSCLNNFFGRELMLKIFIVFLILIFYGVITFFHYKQKVPAYLSLILVVFFGSTAPNTVQLRPNIFSCFFLLVQYLLLISYSKRDLNKKAFFSFFCLIYFLWGNIHTGVSLGLLSLFLMLWGDFFQKHQLFGLKNRLAIKKRIFSFNFYLFLILTGLLVSLLNPFGIKIYTHLWEISSSSIFKETIAELKAVDDLAIFSLIGFLVFFCFLIKQKLKAFMGRDLLLVISFAILNLFAIRFLPWLGLFSLLVLPFYLSKIFRKPKSFDFSQKIYLICFCSVLAWSVFFFTQNLDPKVKLGNSCFYYLKATEFIKDKLSQEKKIFNDSLVAGCILLENPERKVYFDTRYDFYGESFYLAVLKFSSALKDWEIFVQKNQLKFFIFSKRKRKVIIPVLRASAEYKILYEDKNTIIFKKLA